jgi:hypothetical protein
MGQTFMSETILKNHLKISRLLSPPDFYKRSQSIRKKLPKKIPVGEWVNVGSAMQFIVWPYEPVPSALRGGVRMIEFFNYDELRQKFFWKWEYFHDNGDAIKVGKKSGLWITEEDPLLMPGTLINTIYFLIFHTQPSDFIGLRK